MSEFIIPNLGDGVAQGDVLKVLVKVGDALKVDQSVLELETDKATIEVPSDVAGTVKEIKVKAGDKVKPGQAVLVLDGANGASGAAAPKEEPKAEVPKQEAAPVAAAPAPEAPQAPEAPAAAPEKPKASVHNIAAARPAAAPALAAPSANVTSAPAAPSVRRLAREIGVDITQVPGTGPGGRITQDAVKEFSKRVMNSIGSSGQAAAASGVARAGIATRALPDFSKFGEVESKPMSGIRRKTAEHLSYAWNTIPHVTQFDKADITALEQV
ncbi:MAG: Dihydrolipoyllysine-residue acetyltransferase component of pyruvate dehydrogenase complex, partial [Acidobacteriota bacterium]